MISSAPTGLAFDPEERYLCVADTAGRLWTSAGDGVHGYHPDGTLIGEVLIPKMVANVTFGGPKRNRLFICGTTSLYAFYTAVTGAKMG
jgi:gluconolactonase